MMDKDQKIKAAVDEIVLDISDRCGLDHAWDGIDGDIQEEIKDAWFHIVKKKLEE